MCKWKWKIPENPNNLQISHGLFGNIQNTPTLRVNFCGPSSKIIILILKPTVIKLKPRPVLWFLKYSSHTCLFNYNPKQKAWETNTVQASPFLITKSQWKKKYEYIIQKKIVLLTVKISLTRSWPGLAFFCLHYPRSHLVSCKIIERLGLSLLISLSLALLVLK